MKWFFAVNEATLGHKDHDFSGLMLAAVGSALANTTLEPNLIYDGAENEFIGKLRTLGVNIIHHQISFRAEMKHQMSPSYNLDIASGAYLRTEIPNMPIDDEFVLYTDCDVLFLKEPSFLAARPHYFGCAPQFSQTDYDDINTGVMLMNVPQLRRGWPAFREFIVKNFESFLSFDQGAYRTYYRDKYRLLPPEANWKPYWGQHHAAEIIHFHGPKPFAIRRALEEPNYGMPADWRTLFKTDPISYRYHLDLWDYFYHHAVADVSGGPKIRRAALGWIVRSGGL